MSKRNENWAWSQVMERGAFHLVKISGIFGSAVNGTRLKIPRKSGKSKKVGPFSRLEFPNGISCSIYTFHVVVACVAGVWKGRKRGFWARGNVVVVVCTSSRSTVGHRDVPGFTTKRNNFLPLGNSAFAPTEVSAPQVSQAHVTSVLSRCKLTQSLTRESVSRYKQPLRLVWEIKY